MWIIEILPNVTSLWGFVFYSIIAYIFSFTISKVISDFVGRNINVEEMVKKTIQEERRKNETKERVVKQMIQKDKNI